MKWREEKEEGRERSHACQVYAEESLRRSCKERIFSSFWHFNLPRFPPLKYRRSFLSWKEARLMRWQLQPLDCGRWREKNANLVCSAWAKGAKKAFFAFQFSPRWTLHFWVFFLQEKMKTSLFSSPFLTESVNLDCVLCSFPFFSLLLPTFVVRSFWRVQLKKREGKSSSTSSL